MSTNERRGSKGKTNQTTRSTTGQGRHRTNTNRPEESRFTPGKRDEHEMRGNGNERREQREMEENTYRASDDREIRRNGNIAPNEQEMRDNDSGDRADREQRDNEPPEKTRPDQKFWLADED